MRYLAIFFLLLPIACAANPLANTSWMESPGTECPDAIAFEATSYVYFNDCYALGTDGVLEEGRFEVANSEILLLERNIKAPLNFEYWPKDVSRVQIVELGSNLLVLKAGSRIIRLQKR